MLINLKKKQKNSIKKFLTQFDAIRVQLYDYLISDLSLKNPTNCIKHKWKQWRCTLNGCLTSRRINRSFIYWDTKCDLRRQYMRFVVLLQLYYVDWIDAAWCLSNGCPEPRLGRDHIRDTIWFIYLCIIALCV